MGPAGNGPAGHRFGYTIPGALTEGNARRWYAQSLADALARGAWVRIGAAPAKESKGRYRLLARRPDVPMIVEALAPQLAKAGVAPALILLGWSDYQEVLRSLGTAQAEAWWEWAQPRRDKLGRRITPPALFRSAGARVVAGEHTGHLAQGVALEMLNVASVTFHRELP